MAGLGLRQRMQVPQGQVGVARSACGQMPFFPSQADPPPPQAASHTDTKEPVVLCLALGAVGAGGGNGKEKAWIMQHPCSSLFEALSISAGLSCTHTHP